MTIRRMKTYTGGQGYVYQYYFVGKRSVTPPGGVATEFVFDVTSDRKTTFAVSVFLGEEATKTWAANHYRSLTEAEEYGAVKMRLFQGFDEIQNMMTDGRQLTINAEALENLLKQLSVD